MKRWKLSKFEILYRQSWLFRWQLNEAETSSPLPVFLDPWKGNPQNGALIAQGTLPYPIHSVLKLLPGLTGYVTCATMVAAARE